MSDFVTVEIPQRLEFLREPLGVYRIRVVHGGRGGGKTFGAAVAVLEMCATGKTRVLVLRLTEKSLGGTVRETWSEMVDRMGLAGRCERFRDRFEFDNGSVIYFAGLGDGVEAIKSFHDINLAVVEEAQEMTEAGWEILEPTIRGRDSELWLLGNTDPDAFFCRAFVDAEEPEEDVRVVQINFEDNPFIEPSFLRSVRQALRRNYARARAIYYGERYVPEDQLVFANVVVEEFEPPEDARWRFGLDFGLRNPTALVGCYTEDCEDEDGEFAQDLFIGVEFYVRGVPPRKFATEWDRDFPFLRDATIIADIAGSVEIEQIAHDGFRIRGCKKRPGFKEQGIAALANFRRIVIHPGCEEVAREFTQYRYKKLKNGEVTDQIDPRCDDHSIDATRYALQDIIGMQAGKVRGRFFVYNEF